MKVIMLGHSGVGKTTYMASMYGTLQTPINGFSLYTQDSSYHDRLLQAFNKIRLNQYPPRTSQRGEYNFSLLFQGRSVFPFEWVDYRGGALMERQDDSPEARQLVSELSQAEGILVFCDSDPKVRTRARSQIGRMISLVTRALRESEKPTIMAVVFTKADLLDEIDELDEDLVEAVDGLLASVYASKAHVGTLLPIACGSTHMMNPEAPVLFVLHFGIIFQALQLSVELEFYEKADQHFTNKGNTLGGIVSDLFHRWTGDPTNEDYAWLSRQQAVAKKTEIDKLVIPAQGLAYYLQELPIVCGELLREDESAG